MDKIALFLAVIFLTLGVRAQSTPSNRQGREEPREFLGDAPRDYPLAKDVSPAFKRAAVENAMKKVGDWQLARVRGHMNNTWMFAVLEIGLVTASDTLHDRKYSDAVKEMADGIGWQLGPRLAHADDHVVGQSYLWFYDREHQPQMIADIRQKFDEVKAQPDDAANMLWWWCDALFMDPPVWSGLSRATGDRSYLDYMDREWWITSTKLYDQKEHLFSRDERFLDRHEANGRKLFWLRGNGWVIAGLARTLADMPKNYPTRKKYVRMFREMADTFRAQQMSDGLWRPGMLDENAYPLPETSGSGLATYALAWGIHHGILQRSAYLPVVQKAWAGLLSHVYEDGRLGCVQQVGERPDAYQQTSSYAYGVGAFLLAGSEIDHLAKH